VLGEGGGKRLLLLQGSGEGNQVGVLRALLAVMQQVYI